MATLQISIEIDDTPYVGFQDDKLTREFGTSNADIIGRIARANAATFPSFKVDPQTIVLKAVAAAVATAEA